MSGGHTEREQRAVGFLGACLVAVVGLRLFDGFFVCRRLPRACSASRYSYPNTERAFKRMASNVPSPFDKVSSINLYGDYVEFASLTAHPPHSAQTAFSQ